MERFDIVVWIWMGIAVITFLVLLKVTAPYGRHTQPKWGPTIPNRLGWIIMELPSPIIFAVCFLGPLEKTAVSWIFFACWVGHYFHRSLIFPFRIKTAGKRMPLVIVLSAIFFNGVNASTNGLHFGYFGHAYPIDWCYDLRFIIGMLFFSAGMAINIWSDNILLNLRKPGETGYRIPTGGLFKYISCPNHFGEMMEWIGFAIATWSLPALAFAIWTVANLLPRALEHHRWYKAKFSEYPAERRAVIPGLL
ncbi:MAG: DUF1295 domain-containing protein [Chitinophagales bacterium]|nr:DUF1295 domain-containing protein [Chitinophagales bacterium]